MLEVRTHKTLVSLVLAGAVCLAGAGLGQAATPLHLAGAITGFVTDAAVSSASTSVSQDIDNTVGQINRLTNQVATLNADIQNGGAHDEGMQAQLYSSLETLSGLVNINVLQQPGGSVN